MTMKKEAGGKNMGAARMLRTSVVVLTAALLGMQAGALRAMEKPRVTVGEAGFTVHGVPYSELAVQTIGRSLRVFEGYEGEVYSVAFSPDGKQALSGGRYGTLRLWDVASGRELLVFRGHKNLRGFYQDVVYSVAFSSDGKRVLLGSGDGTLRLWDVASVRELRVFHGHGTVWAFSPDGTLRLYDTVWSVAFSPDGSQALSGGSDGTLRLWDVASGREMRVFEGHEGSVYSVAFSPDGSQALSGSGDKTLRLWIVASGAVLRVIQGHTEEVNSVAFGPAGRQVLSGSKDGTLRLWDVKSGRELRVWGHGGRDVSSVAFSPNGRQALSGSFDNKLRLWDISRPNREKIRKAIQKKATEELSSLQHKHVGPVVSKPQLPPRQVLQQDPFESKSMFEERVARADAEWNRKASVIQEKYRADVNARNARVKRFKKNLQSHQRSAYGNALTEVQGHPILTTMEDEAGRPKYDPEQERLHLAFRFEHASEAEDWVFKVPAGDPVRALYQALQGDEAWASAEYRVQEDSVALVSVVVHHGNQAYRGKPALGDFNAPERQRVEIGVDAGGLPDLEQQDPDLNWEIPKTVHSRFSDDIPGLLSRTRAVPLDNRKWLFVIGIGDYSDTDDINYSRRTAETFARVAQKTLGISENRTRLLLDGNATSGRIKNQMLAMLNDVREGDVIYFYYSGHGIPVPEQDNAAFILPQDALPNFIGRDKDYQVDRIYRRLIDSKASSVIAIMDSCFTGITDGRSVFKGEKAATRLAPKIFQPSPTGKLAVLAAGTEKQYSNAYKDKRHRLFSYFVMRALIKGYTNIGDLGARVQDDVRNKTLDLGGGSLRQDPVLQGNPELEL